MTDAGQDQSEDGPPPPFLVYFNPRVHLFKLVAILAICAVLVLVPFWAGNTDPEAARIVIAFAAIFLIWAYLTAKRMRDRRPQVVVDTDGVFVRDWHVGVVPWQDIDFIAHSSSVRRGIVSALTRSRRGPYLLFKFVRTPKVIPTTRPPLSWLQKVWIDMELQEPAIMQFGLDAKATVLLRAIQDHISYWQRGQGAPAGDTTIVSPYGR